MKIVSWNCNRAFRDKYEKVSKYNADIYMIYEAENPDKYVNDLKYKEYFDLISNRIWIPSIVEGEENDNKGILIFAKNDIELKENKWKQVYNDFLSLRINDSFNLIGVWIQGKSSEYINRMEKYLKDNKEYFENSDNLVMCGDFNIDISLDNQKGKDEYIELLNCYGYESIYHKLTNEKFGEELVKTFFGKSWGVNYGLHLDQLFSKPEIITSFEIGTKEEFVDCEGPHSDHVPLIFEVNI